MTEEKRAAMNLTTLINHVETNFPKLIKQKFREFINNIANLGVSDKILIVFQKIQDENLLEKEDIQSLNEELTKISNTKLHDTLVYLLQTMAEQVYEKHRAAIAEIEETKTQLESKFFTGQDLPDLTYDANYDWLFNYQKLTVKQRENHDSFGPIGLCDFSLAQAKTDATLRINALILAGKIPKDCLNALDYPAEIKKIHEKLNNNSQENEFILFSKKINIKNWTFLASNGQTLLYITDEFKASHQYEPFESISSDQYTDKKRTCYHDSDQRYWNFFSDHVIKKAADLLEEDPHFRNLKTLLPFLGEKRQVAAQRLGPGKHHRETYRFGKPRYSDNNKYGGERNDGFVHEFIDSKPNSVWNKLFIPIRDRIEKVKSTSLFVKNNHEYRYQHDSILSKNFGIVYTAYDYDPTIHFYYPYVENEDEYNENLEKLEPEFQNLLSWDGEDLDEFIKNIGKLSYSLYRLLPLSLGTSAVVNWLVRAVALHKGIELGPHQNNEDDLPLDWEAFVTFDQQLYADWFLHHAFTDVRPKNLNSLDELFEWKIGIVQKRFLKELNALNQQLEIHDGEEAKKLNNRLLEEQSKFFKRLTPNLNNAERELLFSNFRQVCKENVEAADKLMGHGWLYRIAEVVFKSIAVIFIGLVMAVGSVIGQGLAKAEDRQRFSNYFFSLNQAEPSKALQQFQQKTLGKDDGDQGLLKIPM